MKKFFQHIALLFIVLSVCPVLAEGEEPIWAYGGVDAQIYSIERVNLVVEDGVQDGCLPRPSSLERSAEAALRRNNIAVVDEDDWSDGTVVINPIGYEIDHSNCAVAFDMWIESSRMVNIPYANKVDGMYSNLTEVNWNVQNGLLTGPKSDMQNRVEKYAEDGANNLFIAIDRARDRIKEKWPRLWEASQEEQ